MVFGLSRMRLLLPAVAVGVLCAWNTEGMCDEVQKQQQELDRNLYLAAPKIVRLMLDRGCSNVGVLKFRVKKGSQPANSNAGPLNTTLSERLTKALILAANKHADGQLGVIANANTIASRRGDATHQDAAGRRALLAEREYELPWKSEEKHVRADALLTGVALTPSTLEELRVVVLSFDRFDKRCMLKKVADFRVPMTAEILSQLNESYVLRGGFEGGKITIRETPKQAVAVREDAASSFPLAAAEAAVRFEVLYNGKPQRVEFRDGKAFVAEPAEGQKVSFALVHSGRAKGRFGAVVKVNGENSIHRERLPNVNCSKWILSPNSRTEIKGYQKANNLEVAEDFKIASDEESARREFDYGRDVGTISVTVFREATQRYTPEIGNEAEDLKAIGDAPLPEEKPESLSALQASLRIAVGNSQTRGLITPGDDVTQRIRLVRFEPDPVPVATSTIHYYKPKRR